MNAIFSKKKKKKILSRTYLSNFNLASIAENKTPTEFNLNKSVQSSKVFFQNTKKTQNKNNAKLSLLF
jgi:hypothetical protein